MNINYILKIEKFIADSLINSEYIPNNVQVVRLADDITTSGITQQNTYISIRYIGSDVETIENFATRLRHKLKFELEIGTQDYLAVGGYELALMLMSSCHLILTNQAPQKTGLQIFRPLRAISEKYKGITTNNQYVYTQTWELIGDVQLDPLPVDPCIAMGSCSSVWSNIEVLRAIPDGYVLGDNGLLFSTVDGAEPIRDIDGKLYNPLTNEVILDINEKLVPTSSPFSANVINATTGAFIRTIQTYSTTKVILRLKSCLFTSKEKNLGVKDKSHLTWSEILQNKGNYSVARVIENSVLYIDPISGMSYDEPIEDSELIFTETNVKLVKDNETYVLVRTTNNKTGWVKEEYVIISETLNSIFQSNCEQNSNLKEDI